MLIRYANGETKVWSVVRAPSAEDEDDRQLRRGLPALQNEQTGAGASAEDFLAPHAGLGNAPRKRRPR